MCTTRIFFFHWNEKASPFCWFNRHAVLKNCIFLSPTPKKIYISFFINVYVRIYIGENVTSHRGCRVYSRAVPETIDQASHSISSPFFFFLYWINFDFCFLHRHPAKKQTWKIHFSSTPPPPFFFFNLYNFNLNVWNREYASFMCHVCIRQQRQEKLFFFSWHWKGSVMQQILWMIFNAGLCIRSTRSYRHGRGWLGCIHRRDL